MVNEKKNHNEVIGQITYDTEDNEYMYETFLKKDGMMSMTNLPLAESFIAFLNETGKKYYTYYIVGRTYYFVYSKRADTKLRKHFESMKKSYLSDMDVIKRNIDDLNVILSEV